MAGMSKKAPRECGCGCGGMTKGGDFMPGHDARLRSRLMKEAEGGSLSAAQSLRDRGWARRDKGELKGVLRLVLGLLGRACTRFPPGTREVRLMIVKIREVLGEDVVVEGAAEGVEIGLSVREEAFAYLDNMAMAEEPFRVSEAVSRLQSLIGMDDEGARRDLVALWIADQCDVRLSSGMDVPITEVVGAAFDRLDGAVAEAAEKMPTVEQPSDSEEHAGSEDGEEGVAVAAAPEEQSMGDQYYARMTEDTGELYFSRKGVWAELDPEFMSDEQFILDGAFWPSVMHYFEASKSLDPDVRESIRMCKTIGWVRRKTAGVEPYEERDDHREMLRAVRTRYAYLDPQQILLSTGTARLHWNSDDPLWGAKGDDEFGRLLEEVRDEIRESPF